MLKADNVDPDSIPPPSPAERAKHPNATFTYDLLRPPPGSQPISNISIIKKSLRDYMADKAEDLVDIWFVQKGKIVNTIIITQGCLLTESHQLSGPMPVATEGEQERIVREWLEIYGDVYFYWKCLSSGLCSDVSCRC